MRPKNARSARPAIRSPSRVRVFSRHERTARIARRGDRAAAPFATDNRYRPGTTLEQARREYGIERIIKLSSNENPLGTSPLALEALKNISDLNIYVDNQYQELREKLARKLGVGVENVTVGHGSNELLELMFETFVDRGERVIMAKPTFSLFPQNAQLREAEAIEVPLKDGVHDLDAMADAIDANTKLVLICDPNNPTATVDHARGDGAIPGASCPRDVLLSFDQAYREFMPDGVDGVALAMRRPNTLVYRTMSKAYGLAALRIGYVIGPSRRDRLHAASPLAVQCDARIARRGAGGT